VDTGQARRTGAKPRHGHTVTFDPVWRRIIGIAGQGAQFFGDALVYDIPANLWTQLKRQFERTKPPVRRLADAAVSHRSCVFIRFGDSVLLWRTDDGLL
jgi:Galactose oxidase, central domain